MTDIEYTIEFHSYWHCGSGLSSGADADAVVIKDKYGLPYVPGKTMKGLIREALENILSYEGKDVNSASIFGEEGKTQGSAYFSNAELSVNEKSAIILAKLSDQMNSNVSATKIDEDGIAADTSLRKIEVTIPCCLEGKVSNVEDEMVDDMKKALAFIRRIGVNRNRGLGRCTITVKQK